MIKPIKTKKQYKEYLRATFILAENCQANNYATLPLIGYYPETDFPDEGIMPDVVVPVKLEDYIKGIDNQLEYTLGRISNRQNH